MKLIVIILIVSSVLLGSILTAEWIKHSFLSGKIYIQNRDPEKEFLFMKLSSGADKVIFYKHYALFELDRSNYIDS